MLPIYATILLASDWWWLAAGAAFAAVIVGLANLAPCRPAADLHVHAARIGSRCASGSSRRVTRGTRIVGVHEWALGTRTRKANAALAGLGQYRGGFLVSGHDAGSASDDEIEVVLAHELGHHVHHDIWRAIAPESLVVVLGFFAADRALSAFGPVLGLAGT